MTKKDIKTNTFEFVEQTQITKKGKETFWFTQKNVEGYSNMVGDSLSFTKDEAEKMFHLIVEHNGIMKQETILKSIEVVDNGEEFTIQS